RAIPTRALIDVAPVSSRTTLGLVSARTATEKAFSSNPNVVVGANGAAERPGSGTAEGRLAAEDAPGVPVGEHTRRIHSVADGEEVIEPRIQAAQLLRTQPVHLSPVGPAAELRHDLRHGAEVLPILHPQVLMNGDVPAAPAVGGGEPGVVGGDEAYFDGEWHRYPRRIQPAAHLGQRGGHRLDRDRVLHLPKPHPPGRDE